MIVLFYYCWRYIFKFVRVSWQSPERYFTELYSNVQRQLDKYQYLVQRLSVY